jgi:hypothetical protein
MNETDEVMDWRAKMGKPKPWPWRILGRYEVVDKDGDIVTDTYDDVDARLICAAPELLQRLIKRVNDCACVALAPPDYVIETRCEDCLADLAIINKAESR